VNARGSAGAGSGSTLGSRFFIEEMIEAKAFSIPAKVVKMPFFDPPRKKA